MTVRGAEVAGSGKGASVGDAGVITSVLARLRRDAPWWLLPVTVVVVLGGFIVYSIWASTTGVGEARNAPYLSPLYSPGWLANHIPVFPGLLCILVPIAFRGTCYYYRKAYHRSFLWDPPGCAVPELRHRGYRGETAFPLSLNNLHRFALYGAIVYIPILAFDAANAFSLGGHLYLGLGTAIMVLNVVLLAGYTFSCHSFRHLVGGSVDCFSCVRFGRQRHSAWRAVTRLNIFHPTWAWVSLFSVWAVDVYVRMLNAGWFTDPHILFR
ncbi:MAG TPA: succinate dehydrogenase [Candidatus Dormibacteraeota bacterium]